MCMKNETKATLDAATLVACHGVVWALIGLVVGLVRVATGW